VVLDCGVLSVTSLGGHLNHALPTDLFRCHAHSPKGHTQSAEAFWIHRIAYVPFLEERPPEARLNSNLLELIGPSHD